MKENRTVIKIKGEELALINEHDWHFSEPTAQDYASIVEQNYGPHKTFTVFYNGEAVCGFVANEGET